MKIFAFSELENDFNNNRFINVIKKINFNISRDAADVYQLELLAICYLKINNIKNSLIVFEHIKKKYPHFHQVNINYGNALRINKEYKKALHVYNLTLIKDKNNYYLINNIGVTFQILGNKKKAIECYEKSISINPSFEKGYVNLAKLFKDEKKFQLVSQTLIHAIKNCDDKDNLKNLLATHYIEDLHLFKKAELIYKKLIINKTTNPHVYHNYGYHLQRKNIKIDEAMSLVKKSILLKKNFYEAINTLGMLYYKKGNLTKAISLYKQSLNINNEFILAKHNLGVAYIRKNINLDHAWKLRETRRIKEFSHYFKNLNKIWNGEEKINKLYIWNEQGVGDEILFLNTLHLTSKYANVVYVHLNFRLKRFYQRFLNLNDIKNIKLLPLKRHDTNKKNSFIKKCDRHIAMGSLPMIFLRNINCFKNIKFPYLITNKSENLLKSNKIKIGISWKTTNMDEQNRNIELKTLLPLLKNKKYQFFNLQFGNIEKEVKFLNKNNVNFFYDKKIDYKNDFNYITNLINNVDIVLTIQNTNAHLCGAMNKKFIILLQNYCRMNWGYKGTATYWYPSATVIRNNAKNYFINKKILVSKIEKSIKKTLDY